MLNTSILNKKISSLPQEKTDYNSTNTFQQNKAFFARLEQVNQASVNNPAFVTNIAEPMGKTKNKNFVSSLYIGSLLPNTEPTHKAYEPMHKITFGTQNNKNIDISPINYDESLSHFKSFKDKHSFISYSPHMLKKSTAVINNSIINSKQDSSPMSVNKINTPEVGSQYNFRFNRTATFFSNSIHILKSCGEKTFRHIRNKPNKNNNEELRVKYKDGKVEFKTQATIARENLENQRKGSNDNKTTPNEDPSLQQENFELRKLYDTLLDEINQLESTANDMIINNDGKSFQYYNHFKKLNIMDILNLPQASDEKYKKIADISKQMNESIRTLDFHIKKSAKIEEFKTNELLSWDDGENNWYIKNNETLNTGISALVKELNSQNVINDGIDIINKSNTGIINDDAKAELNYFLNDNFESLNSNYSSSHKSISSDSSGYSSAPNNNELENKELDNTKTTHKKHTF